ncbi:spermatogenesis-associated serine-rich protein 1 [Mus caroli]|uniref:Spermatogenesis-associated serine-rich protein 1 n=1 Tax=Mus caroli TaxID=10089 RepID=A0A6P7QM47_MUSCR|nr:spermatogenesis-associated serine-rich protein 1 [Mus caroli]
MESSKDTQHGDALESKSCLANRTSSRQNKRISLSSSDGPGPRVTESLGLPRVLTPSDTAAELGQKTSSSSSSSSSSAQSNRSSKVSLPEIQKEKYPEEFSLLNSQTEDGQRPEWTFYPRFSSNIHTYHIGKQCFFNGVFRGNRRSVAERTVDSSLGKKRYGSVFPPSKVKKKKKERKRVPAVEPAFSGWEQLCRAILFSHSAARKTGRQRASFQVSTANRSPGPQKLPPTYAEKCNWQILHSHCEHKGPYEKKFDTFIPLEPLPKIPNLPFWEKEKANNLKNEIKEVEELDNWQVPMPFLHGFFSTGASNFSRQQ